MCMSLAFAFILRKNFIHFKNKHYQENVNNMSFELLSFEFHSLIFTQPVPVSCHLVVDKVYLNIHTQLRVYLRTYYTYFPLS